MIIRDEVDALPGGQTTGALRSRILLGVLVDQEAKRLGLHANAQQLDATMRWFRTQFFMAKRADVEAFMAFAGLDLAALTAQMRTFANISIIAERYALDVDQRMPAFNALRQLEDRNRGVESL